MEKSKNGLRANGIVRRRTAKRLFFKQSGRYSNVWVLHDASSARRMSIISLRKKGEIHPSQYPHFL